MDTPTKPTLYLALCLLVGVLSGSDASPAAAEMTGPAYTLAVQNLGSAVPASESGGDEVLYSPLVLAAWAGSMASVVPVHGDPVPGSSNQRSSTEPSDPQYSGGSGSSFPSTTLNAGGIPTPTFGNMFFKGWFVITGVEVTLLGVCAALPRSFTGWSDHMVDDALTNLNTAFTKPPVWDDDAWAINYVGHPYGGAVYFNTVRSQGASFLQSFLFSTALSVQWEYIVEAVAEPPSTQDLLFTSTTGALLGEAIHAATQHMKQNGTNLFEKAFILVFNPTSVVMTGFN